MSAGSAASGSRLEGMGTTQFSDASMAIWAEWPNPRCQRGRGRGSAQTGTPIGLRAVGRSLEWPGLPVPDP